MYKNQNKLEFIYTSADNSRTSCFRSSIADLVKRNVDGEIGLVDRASQRFLTYRSRLAQPFAGFLGPDFHQQPASSFFYDQLNGNDRRFVKDSIDQVSQFLEKLPDNHYSKYQLTVDACLKNTDNEYLRLMCHLVFLPSVKGWPEGGCLVLFHRISTNCSYSPPLRCFYETDSRQRVLFKDGEGSMPEFSDCRCAILELLMMGKVSKEAAEIRHCSKSTIDNTINGLLRCLHLTNRLHLVHYLKCFGRLND
ncbi:LuxR C-terminal-related transcriptional regulator [Mangrovibacterium marinum]|uniref:DNA-binding CsgD family transcriptional regulator n=1 Tax=Mangrovibacterium marinum TaxID=1639118 RepID=A0A2T5C4L8_9BACT|nr:LuxR C-terminal-related transcriptional regulator [Mangrovibacterium marinum]PTN09794.1 DNA-binding CsgD family transcriptional regulator [Mangrovibacterium marinum]